jgi:Mg2+ and Co2+ transporter CorA
MDEQAYKDQIAALEKEVDVLEEAVKELEAEGLKPLVDRLRTQISSIKKLTKAMATAIDELLERKEEGE